MFNSSFQGMENSKHKEMPEERPTQMTTLSSIMERLRVSRKDKEFRWAPGGFTAGTGKFYQPEDLTILKTYRFEGESDPAESSILYIIEANDGLTGYSLDMYGAYSNHEDEQNYNQFIRQIRVSGRDEQLIFGEDGGDR